MEPSDADWDAIQEAVDQDCPLSMAMQLIDGRADAASVMDRIAKYASAAFARGVEIGKASPAHP